MGESKRFTRTEALLGTDAMARLKKARVAIFGIGGVGGYALEGLVRSGIGNLTLIDSDTVSISNLNRQVIATEKTVGKLKTAAAKERCLEINPEVNITEINEFFSEENADSFDFSSFDYVIDAIDTVNSKCELIKMAKDAGTPIISSMGTGGKLNPTELEIADIYKTSVCPLAKAVRTRLRRMGIKNLKVVYSKEEPIRSFQDDSTGGVQRRVPGSVSFVPSVAGLIIASEVIKDLIKSM